MTVYKYLKKKHDKKIVKKVFSMVGLSKTDTMESLTAEELLIIDEVFSKLKG